jgi:glycerol-3-phosphate acyltransferase PlsX
MERKRLRIALDCMGGDLGPRPCVEGALMAVQRFNIEVLLVGKERHINRLLSTKTRNLRDSRLTVVHAEEVVTMMDNPRDSLRKKNSSLAIAVDLVKRGEADAAVSPANTGAFLAHALFGWRTLPGIKKPAIAALLPTPQDRVVIIDSGAVMDAKPHQIVNFGIMGATYARVVLDRPNPRVGLMSIGEEESKGNEVTLLAHQLLRKTGLNFIGNAEGRDIWTGDFDVICCDGFVGNVVLKTSEGLARMITEQLKKEAKKAIPTMVGGALMWPAVKAIKRRTDYDESGGAPLLGVNGVAIICHGSSNAKAIMNALRVAAESVSRRLVEQLKEDLERYHTHMQEAGISREVVFGEVAPDAPKKVD